MHKKMFRAAVLWTAVLTGVAACQASDHLESVLVRKTSVPGMPSGVRGTLDIERPDALVVKAGASNVAIPYKDITGFHYAHPVAHHLGFFPAMAAGMFAPRVKVHLFLLTWTDAAGTPQVAELEVGKGDSPLLLDLLRGRASQVCKAERVPRMCGVDSAEVSPTN